MIGKKFKGANKDYGPPKGMTEKECFTLPTLLTLDNTYRTPVIISCWQMSKEEFEECIKNNGKIYLKVFTDDKFNLVPMSMSSFPHEEIQMAIDAQEIINNSKKDKQ